MEREEKSFGEIWAELTTEQTEYLKGYIGRQRQDAVKHYQSKELNTLQKENEELREFSDYKIKAVELLTKELSDSYKENTKLKERQKELIKQADCYHHNEEMHQGDGSVYVTCKDCGTDL